MGENLRLKYKKKNQLVHSRLWSAKRTPAKCVCVCSHFVLIKTSSRHIGFNAALHMCSVLQLCLIVTFLESRGMYFN